MQIEFGLGGKIDDSLRHEHVTPEVPEGPGAPHRRHEFGESIPAIRFIPPVQGRIRQERLAQVTHRRDVDGRPLIDARPGPCPVATCRPPAPVQGRCRDDRGNHLVALGQGDEGGPHRNPAGIVRSTVDGVDDPASRPGTGVGPLLTVDGIAGSGCRDDASCGILHGQIGVGHLAVVRLVVDAQVAGPEPSQRQGIGLIGNPVGQGKIVKHVHHDPNLRGGRVVPEP